MTGNEPSLTLGFVPNNPKDGHTVAFLYHPPHPWWVLPAEVDDCFFSSQAIQETKLDFAFEGTIQSYPLSSSYRLPPRASSCPMAQVINS